MSVVRERERDSCNSHHLSRLMKSCFPNTPHSAASSATISTIIANKSLQCTTTVISSFSSLPDDAVLECLSRVPPSSIPILSQVCRRWASLVSSPPFSHLRRLHGHLHHSLFVLSASSHSTTLFAATLRIPSLSLWKLSAFLPNDAVTPFHTLLSHACLCAIGQRIYIIARNATLRYDTWTGAVTARCSMIFPRKKFAAAVVSGKIYVAGGGLRATAVEEYDPDADRWSVVSHAPRRRYGCIGASAAGGVLCVIGGLKIGASGGEDAHVYAGSMDLYEVEGRRWLRSRCVPGGGCVVAACAAGENGEVYVLASHAVELSFWRFKLLRGSSRSSRKGELFSGSGGSGGSGGGDGCGEWCRIRSPPVGAQVRMESRVRMRYSCVGVGEKVVLVQVSITSSGRMGLVLVYDTCGGEWSRAPDLPDVITRAACVSLEC